MKLYCLNCRKHLDDYYASTQYCNEDCKEEHHEFLMKEREDDSS